MEAFARVAAAGLISAGLFLLGSCEKPAERVVPLSAVEQTLVPAAEQNTPPSMPSPSVTSGLSAPLQPRFAPKGIYYVVKYFSIATDSGIFGFQPGKQVSLLKEAGKNFVVTDGVTQATAPKASFTNDMNIVEGLTKRNAATAGGGQPPAAEPGDRVSKFEEAKSRLAAKTAQRMREQGQALQVRKKQKLQDDVADLKKRISAAEKEIAEKKSSQRPVRRTYDAWGNLISYQGRSMYTLSQDASALDRLTAQRAKLEQQLADLGDE